MTVKDMNKRGLERVMVFGIVIALLLHSENTFALSGMMPKTVKIEIQKEWKGYHCGYTEPSRVVIYTEDQWKEIWEKVHILRLPRPGLPKIDFEKNMVVAVFMGKRSEGGYEIEITKINKTEEEIIVEVKEKEPPPGSLRTMALPQPYHIVVIKRSLLPVRFQYP